MINITFKAEGPPDLFNEILKEVNIDLKKIRTQIDNLGIETENEMKQIIISSKVRPQADEQTFLENALHTDKFVDGGWGLGDIERLKKEAPGWAALNFGSTHLVGKRMPGGPGTFYPGEPAPHAGSFRTGRWWIDSLSADGKTKFRPIVTKPIIAINYIQRTIFWLENRIDAIFNGEMGGA